MIFTGYTQTIPAPASGLTIGLDACEADLVTEVHIISGDKTLGVKRYRGSASYTINAECYLEETLAVEPYYSATFCGYRELPSRIGSVGFRAVQYEADSEAPPYGPGWIESDQVEYTAGEALCEPWRFSMEMDGDLEMCLGECIELPVLIPSGRLRSALRISGAGWSTLMTLNYTGEARNRMFSYFINTAYLKEAIDYKFDRTIELDVTLGSYDSDEELTKKIFIREVPSGGTRLCWVNRFGTTDYFTFSPVRSTLSTVEKSRVEGAAGARVARARSQEVFTVCTPYTTPGCMERLAGLSAARKVWHMSGDGMLPVDILTGKVSAHWDRPGSLELSFRYC
ncbi:MAG: hypothetical protein LUE10_03825 [Alistipes sp.]|nr:hypothetical protein [Alistipes sp.]